MTSNDVDLSMTSLEAATLICVYRNAPCTTHLVRTEFLHSPVARYSNSAGAIYPLMRRLERRGLVCAHARPTCARNSRLYSCTNLGTTALLKWVGPPVDNSAAITVDPLRTQMLGLSVLDPTQRLEWFDQAESMLRSKIDELSKEVQDAKKQDIYFNLARKNSLMESRTRLRWIRICRRSLIAAEEAATVSEVGDGIA